MRKIYLFVLVLVSCFNVFGQQKQYIINWDKAKTLSGDSFSRTIPSFNKKNFNYELEKGLTFVDQWVAEAVINETSVSISDVVFQDILERDLGDLELDRIPSELKFSLKNSKARSKLYLLFEISPIIKDENGTFKKLISFQVNYQNYFENKFFSRNNASKLKVITNSVLGSGEWYRFYVDTTGVFKLSKSFLKRLGLDVNSVDPRTIKIYGHGGRMIPFSNAVEYPLDVPENAIKFVGEVDGVFNDSDYILFYGQGPKEFNMESRTHLNCYTDKTYYYVNVSPGNGKRIQEFTQPSGTANMVLDTFIDYQFFELDVYNILGLGRRWFANKFDLENSKTYKFNFPNLVLTEPVNIVVSAAAFAASDSALGISVNNENVATVSIRGVSTPSLANGNVYRTNRLVNNSEISVKVDFDNLGNPSTIGYLDFVTVEGERQLIFNDKQFLFKNNAVVTSSGIVKYNMANTSNLSEIWDVTDIANVSNYINRNEDSNLSFTADLGVLRNYVAVAPSDYFSPKFDSKTVVSNQDLKGTIFKNSKGDFQDIDYIIVSPNNMLNSAERLAQINRAQYDLNVKVVGLDEIYNEFSSGNQDVGAIRNMVKYVYDNASTPENKLKYLCLFGDGSYDYKDRIRNNTNIVPSWYSYNSFSLAASFVSDDFYGMMDENEGTMASSDKLDIAVGRILADTPQRGKDMVDKIESYYAKESLGSWRNNFVVVSDDNDAEIRGDLQTTTNDIADVVSLEKPFINVTKIHTDAFQQESSAGGDRYPKVTTEFVNAINNGALVVNYFGHGGEDGLAQERILLKPDILSLQNTCRLNCFVTVTCEFTRFDNPFRETAGEFTFWNKETGAIGLITTTRQVFVGFGIVFNRQLGQYLFSFSENDSFGDNEYPTVAEALRLTKNDSFISGNSQKNLVFYIGDPAMKLAFPKTNIKLTKINDNPIETATDTLKALSYVKLAGEVTDEQGRLLSDYTGTLSATIYDKFLERQTLANDGIRRNGELVKLDFTTLGAIIFRGQASVVNGQFEFDFIVPKDVGIPVGFGKVSFYSKNEALTEDQAGGSANTIRIGGLNENAPEDNTGPVLTLFMNDENFVTGGITNDSPTLIVKLEDPNGINTASGIGHDIVAIIDGDETNPVILNDYYETNVDDYTKGTISFAFRDFEPGLHTLTLRAWDVYNNSSVSEMQFVVFDEDQGLEVSNVLNYPNPFVNYTEFWFNHNSSEPLDVSVQVFTVSGKLVRTLNGQTSGGVKAVSSVSRDIIWDGRDDFGEKIGKGVYIYKLKVRSNILNQTVEKIEKLVIL